MDEPIVVKFYTVVIYDLTKCMKEDNSGTNFFKGENFELTLLNSAMSCESQKDESRYLK